MQLTSTTHQALLAAGIAIITYAGLAGGDEWKEFYQYFRESKFVSTYSLFPIVDSSCHCISFRDWMDFSNHDMLFFDNLNRVLLVY